MHKQLEIIKKNEGKPKVLKNIFNKEEKANWTDVQVAQFPGYFHQGKY